MNYSLIKSKNIHPTVSIAPFCLIEEDVEIEEGCIIHSHVIIKSGVKIARNVEVFPGAFIGKEPKGTGCLARKPTFEKKIIIGENSSIGPNAIVYYDVLIGSNCLIGDGASIREKVNIGNNSLISRYVTINYNTKIGDRVKCMDMSHLTGNMVIENDVFIGVHVSTTNDNNLGSDGYSEDDIIGPYICRGAKIGSGVVMLPKTVVGINTIVAAGSVVTKNLEEESTYAGVPARLVKKHEN